MSEALLVVLDEVSKYSNEWRKCMRKYGTNDKRTVEAYNRFLGINRAREILMELVETMEDNNDGDIF